MYYGRNLEELSMVPVSDWSIEELSYHHYTMSQLTPLMNQQGVSFHQDIIREIIQRGGIQAQELPSYTSHQQDFDQ